jgi:hypothetical protein
MNATCITYGHRAVMGLVRPAIITRLASNNIIEVPMSRETQVVDELKRRLRTFDRVARGGTWATIAAALAMIARLAFLLSAAG